MSAHPFVLPADAVLACAECGKPASDPVHERHDCTAPSVAPNLSGPPNPLIGTAAIKAPEGFVCVPKWLVDFLYGTGPDPDGMWFGDRHEAQGAFWWRKYLRTLAAAPAASPVAGWTRVADKKPPVGQWVVSWREGEARTSVCQLVHARLDDEDEYLGPYGHTTVTSHAYLPPTHWMPLPATPTDGRDGT